MSPDIIRLLVELVDEAFSISVLDEKFIQLTTGLFQLYWGVADSSGAGEEAFYRIPLGGEW